MRSMENAWRPMKGTDLSRELIEETGVALQQDTQATQQVTRQWPLAMAMWQIGSWQNYQAGHLILFTPPHKASHLIPAHPTPHTHTITPGPYSAVSVSSPSREPWQAIKLHYFTSKVSQYRRYCAQFPPPPLPVRFNLRFSATCVSVMLSWMF